MMCYGKLQLDGNRKKGDDAMEEKGIGCARPIGHGSVDASSRKKC